MGRPLLSARPGAPPGPWTYLLGLQGHNEEEFDRVDGNDGVARLAAQLEAIQIEMQQLRNQNQDPPRTMPSAAGGTQDDHVDLMAGRRARQHARMDVQSPTGSESDRQFRDRDRRERREFSDMFGQTFNDDGHERSYKPKFEKPGKIVAKYREEYNILNTIINFELYMANHSITIDKYTAYAVSYFDEVIQLWYDGRYAETPNWARLRKDLISRYLEPDHALRVRLKFEEISQGGSLLDYYYYLLFISDTP
eukprot:3310402-Rhodomonas_salina.1